MERKQLKALLNAKKKELSARIDDIHTDVFKRHNKKNIDEAMEKKKEEALYTLEESAILELDHINLALFRLKTDNFDKCSQCGNTISDEQFKAIPYTEYCVDCAKEHFPHFTLHAATH